MVRLTNGKRIENNWKLNMDKIKIGRTSKRWTDRQYTINKEDDLRVDQGRTEKLLRDIRELHEDEES